MGRITRKQPVTASGPQNIQDSFEFLSDDFTLRGNSDDTQIDRNFASLNYWVEVRNRFFSNKSAVFSLVLVIVIAVLAAFGPLMSGYSYSTQNLAEKNFAPRVQGLENIGIFNGDESLKTTTGTKLINGYEDKKLTDVYYWFGSDVLGRDIWTRVWEGTRISLGIALCAAIIDMIIGMSYGLISGYFGGKVDSIMCRIAEIINGIPRLVIVTLLMLVLPRGFVTIVFALMITEWIGMSRIARAEMLKLKEQEFVLASRTLGAKDFFIIFKEILPNTIGQIITQLMFSIPTAIFTEAFLSFVGLGIPVPMCSLGSLISDAFNSFTTHPYQIIPPILVLALLMLCFNMLADGLREAFDPKLKEM
ncbi:MAG: ABC transporter permease [Oscillospiraceae bacterium]|nr:ABC transporter permease [Oscillospiraceae bacterium]